MGEGKSIVLRAAVVDAVCSGKPIRCESSHESENNNNNNHHHYGRSLWEQQLAAQAQDVRCGKK